MIKSRSETSVKGSSLRDFSCWNKNASEAKSSEKSFFLYEPSHLYETIWKVFVKVMPTSDTF